MCTGLQRIRSRRRRCCARAIEADVDHIDTSDFYGPHVVNQLIKETLVSVSRLAGAGDQAGRDGAHPDAGWHPAQTPAELRSAAEDNLRNLGLDVLEVVNLRLWSGAMQPPANNDFRPQFETMLEMQREGKIKHIGLSNAHPLQAEAAVQMGQIVCVQNSYGVLNRGDDALVEFCAARGIAFVPFFPLGGGFSPLKAEVLDGVAAELGATAHQVALAWLLHRQANILLIPGTSKVAHLKENLAAASIKLSSEQLRRSGWLMGTG